jgi:hypothetical protein
LQIVQEFASMKSVATCALALLTVATASIPASAADYLMGPAAVAAPVTICNEHKVLTRVVERFHYADANLLKRGLSINDFSNITYTRYEPRTERNLIERHYCRATANLNDNTTRTTWYLIETDMGFAGAIGDNVESCVAGLDPLYVYGATCASLR